ncbi:hypothetical protein [Streptomyces sp. NPDC048187]|uniref:hypothetical protein n=1 Tax=Streptomyces sp. NPDC048187 TaxID=3365509 RepID=UPI00371771F9
MEQRRGSTSQPLEGAGFDPAFIPGLTAPVSGEPQDVRRAEADEDGDAETEEASKATVADEPPAVDAEGAAEPEDEAPVDGPVFEAADRRARIVADHKGVRLSLDDQSCEFRWDEVGAVETETGRFGKRFTVTVHTPDSRWYPIEIEAASRSRFAEWEAALDEVLDAYFDDGDGDGADGEAESEPEPGSEPRSESAVAPAKTDDEAEGAAQEKAQADDDTDGPAEAKSRAE